MPIEHAKPRTLVLASASPRREQLLREAGYDFLVQPSRLREPDDVLEVPAVELAEALSFFKAREVAEMFPEATVLGADTVVSAGGAIFGKAADVDDARRILRKLMRTPQEVITGVTLYCEARRERIITHDVTGVTMSPMSEAQLEAYLQSGQWQGKAGAYGIQDHDDQFVERLEGSFTNVVGLPMELVCSLLAAWGHTPARDWKPDRRN